MKATSQINVPCKYDVFLSFRGKDTRNNFTSHLHTSPVRSGIYTFIDDQDLRRGENISPALEKAIEVSRFSLVVFSKNYASSPWCLDELVKIICCKKSKGLIIRPIFFDVNPSEVRNQKGNFGEALAKHEQEFKKNQHEQEFKKNEERLERWKAALTEAGNLSGWTIADGNQSKLIQEIVRSILNEVNRSPLSVPKHLVGIEPQLQEINSLLDINSDNVHMVGIYGVHGVGKTTIAKIVYNLHAHHFDGSSYVEGIRERTKPTHQITHVQEALLSEILADTNVRVHSIARGVSMIKERLSSKRVFLVLDDVNDIEQLKRLAGECNWFGSGSRIIITTRDKNLLDIHEVQATYEMKRMGRSAASQLFSWHAFNRNKPAENNLKLVATVVNYSKGIPLLLFKLGEGLHPCSKLDEENRKGGENHTLAWKWNILREKLERGTCVVTETLDSSMEQFFREVLEMVGDVDIDALDKCSDVDWDDNNSDLESVKTEESEDTQDTNLGEAKDASLGQFIDEVVDEVSEIAGEISVVADEVVDKVSEVVCEISVVVDVVGDKGLEAVDDLSMVADEVVDKVSEVMDDVSEVAGEVMDKFLEVADEVSVAADEVEAQVSEVVDKVPKVVDDISVVAGEVVDKVSKVVAEVPEVVDKVSKVVDEVSVVADLVVDKVSKVADEVSVVADEVSVVADLVVDKVVSKVADEVSEVVDEVLEMKDEVVEKVSVFVDKFKGWFHA